MRRQAGFTMIEVMIVVAIVAILAAVAYPGYTDYVRRGKIAEALGILGDTRTRLEQFFLDNRSYTGADAVNMPCDPNAGNAKSFNAGKKLFTYACDLANNIDGSAGYTITASGKSSEGMGGFQYRIDARNVRDSTITGVSGWSGNASCWVTKKGGVC